MRVPVENVLGKVNDGWNVAVSTLMYERGSFGARLHLLFKRNIDRLIELSRTFQRNGHPAASDPLMRQKLAQCYGEIEIMRLNQLRAFSRITATGVPGPEGSIQKIFWSELNQRLQQVAQELLGPYGQLARAMNAPLTKASGHTAICELAGTRSKRAHRKCSATSSGISFSGCREATEGKRWNSD